MSSSVRITLMAAAAGAVAAGLSLTAGRAVLRRIRNWRRKNPAEIERLRRLAVNRTGRITSGEIVDLLDGPEQGRRIVLYQYEVAGVTYESSQEITDFASFPAAGFAGLVASIKYDPHRPTNSIIACEDWNGWTGAAPGAAANESVVSEDGES
ncbi:MAG: hypothetical protein ACRD3D_12235 [Terriglobia bacterium]